MSLAPTFSSHHLLVLAARCLLVLLGQALPCLSSAQCHDTLPFLSSLRQALIASLAQAPSDSFPTLCFDPQLPANARFEAGTITLGTLQRDYHSRGDTLSLIYHEYVHFLQMRAGRFPTCVDSNGVVIQIQTGELYPHTPDSIEIAYTLEGVKQSKTYIGLDSLAQKRLLAQLRKDLSMQQWLPFLYAPSELALAELEAYQFQMQGEHQGLYQLTEEARQAIKRRMQQLEETYQRRRAYENRTGRSSHGCLK